MAISNVLRDSFNKHIKEHGENVLVDNIPTRAFFKEYDDKKNSHDHKYIFTNIGLVKQGSIIMLRGQKWLSIAHIENINGVYEKSLIREIKFCLKWQDKAIPCVIDSRMQSENSGQFITLPTGNVNITVQENSETKEMVEGNILYVANQKWKIEGIDYSKMGLITFYCIKNSWQQGEERIWCACEGETEEPIEIEEPEEPIEEYTYELAGSNEIRLNQSQTFTAIKKLNGEVVESVFNFTIDYMGNATSIVSITSQTGNSITLKASSNTSFIGKIIKLIASVDDEKTKTT